MVQQSKIEFWQNQLNYCESELKTETTDSGRKALQDEIDYAKEQIQKIKDGTYEGSEIIHEVLTIQIKD